MAWLERDRSGFFHAAFRLGEKRFKKSLRTKDRRQAQSCCARIDENIRLVERGRLTIPPGANIATFLLSDGKLNGHPVVPKPVSLDGLFTMYLSSVPTDSLEPETMRVVKIHMGHIESVFGGHFSVGELTGQHLQDYVNHRSKKKGKRGKRLSAITIKKELGTFSAVWNWGAANGILSNRFPNRNLRFPKTSDKPPFQTWAEIEYQAQTGHLNERDQAELWDCLFLDVRQVEEVLSFIQEHAEYAFLHPMAVMAAHTGARRSELCRSQTGDLMLDNGFVLIREKKRVKGRRSLRQVPVTPKLGETLREWLRVKRASLYTFPREFKVRRERKPRTDDDAVSVDEASDHLQRTLAQSRWQNIRGWHIFRHSFISNCAGKGVDQRMIDRWVGHQTEEMRRRYTHLFPDAQREAVAGVFAGR